jgi:hypothetical protein
MWPSLSGIVARNVGRSSLPAECDHTISERLMVQLPVKSMAGFSYLRIVRNPMPRPGTSLGLIPNQPGGGQVMGHGSPGRPEQEQYG